MIETGTPSSHATPYFIWFLPSHNSVRGMCNVHSKRLGITVAITTVEVVMRAFNQDFGSPSMALLTESVDVSTAFKKMLARLRRKVRHFLCTVTNGGHELYRAHSETKLYQACLLCGYETPGWTIDRRDRRLHLVSNHASAARR